MPKDKVTAQRRIVAAAIYHGTIISLPPPARHHTILRTMDITMGIDALVPPQNQGFLTSDGIYVNRVEAWEIAERAGQIKRNTSGRPELFSEDLWDEELPGQLK